MRDNSIKAYLIILCSWLGYLSPAYSQTVDTALEAKVWEGIGGKENWQNARYFMFSCIGGENPTPVQGERRYLWDKQTGDCRFEGITTNGDTIVVLFNVKTAAGTAYVNNNQQQGQQSADALIAKALEAFEQDANLLFLPTSLEGQGVNYTVEEEKLIGSKRFMVISLQNHKTSFETSVKGHLYVNEQTGHIQRWLPHQTNQPDYYAISGFKDIGGGLVLPTHFERNDSAANISYPLAAALVNIESHKFNRP